MTDHARRARHTATSGEERRQHVRRPASAVPDLKARLLAGPEVRLVDISRRGVLLETDTRLLPGSPIRIKFVANDASLVMKGTVIRSSITMVSGEGVVYRTAVSFEEDIAVCDESTWVADAPAAPVPEPEPETEPGTPPAENTSGRVIPLPAQPATPAPPQPTATVTTQFASSAADLRALLTANDW